MGTFDVIKDFPSSNLRRKMQYQEKIIAQSYVTVCRLSPGNPRKNSPGKTFFLLLAVFESKSEKQKTAEKETKNPKHVDIQLKAQL